MEIFYCDAELKYYIYFDLAPALKIDSGIIFMNNYLDKQAVLIENIRSGWPICEVYFEEDESYPKLTVK